MKKIIVLFLSLLLTGCVPGHLSPCKNITRQLVSMPEEDAAKEFAKYDQETQYCIFLFSQQVIHPPDGQITDILAKQPSILPFLVNKLKQTTDPVDIRDIVCVIWTMQYKNIYQVNKDKDLMNLLNKKADEMKNSLWESTVRDFIEQIKSESS